jgi:cytochrome c oxidase subunit 2
MTLNSGAIFVRSGFTGALCLVLAGCGGIQSALDPAGHEAEQLDLLFQVMLVGGAIIYVATMALLLYAARRHERRKVYSEQTAGRLILWGTVGTTAILFVLLAVTLWVWTGLRPWNQLPDEPRLEIAVTGEQFWWRVSYHPPGGKPVVIEANEVRLPVGQRVNFRLDSADVIHSFWIPSLGGKMDMIPGRTNHLSLLATKPGTFRGPCAEFCGTSHALMAFSAVAMEPADFEAWLAERSQPAKGAGGEGLDAFLAQGCGACHAIRGTPAEGRIGPDLSYLGARLTVGAGILPNDVDNIARFIREPDRVKPGVKMPSYAMLPDNEIQAIARYLKGLE